MNISTIGAVRIVLNFINFFAFFILSHALIPNTSQAAPAPRCSNIFVSQKIFSATQAIERAIKVTRSSLESEGGIGFIHYLKEQSIQRPGTTGPKAFKYFMPRGVSYLRYGDPNQEHPAVAGRINTLGAGHLKVSLPWRKQLTTTDIYFNNPSVPAINSENIPALQSRYLIGPEHQVVIWRIHGGGTNSAVAMNASTTAEFFRKRGIPLLAVTQPGHGGATRIPMGSIDEVLDWNFALMKQLIHPDVKIILNGHSWGGQFTLYAHRIWNGPKYEQIVGFIPESPVINASLSNDWKMQLANEQKLSRKIGQILSGEIADSEGLLDKMSIDDVKFLNNMIENGKINPIGSLYSTITALDYSMSLLPESTRRSLKPMKVFMGRNDALVFVGREDVAKKYLDNLADSSEFYLLEKGKTFKGNTDKTGHQIADNMMVMPDGKEVHEVLQKELEFIHKVTGASGYDTSTNNGVMELLQSLWIKYQTNFAFAEYLKSVDTFSIKEQPSVLATQKEASQIEEAVTKYAKKSSLLLAEQNQDVIKSMQRLSADYGIILRKDLTKTDVATGIASASSELALSFSEARIQMMRNYAHSLKEIMLEFEKNSSQIKNPEIRSIKKQVEQQRAADIQKIKNDLLSKKQGDLNVDQIYAKASQFVELERKDTKNNREIAFVETIKSNVRNKKDFKNEKQKLAEIDLLDFTINALKEAAKNHNRNYNSAAEKVYALIALPTNTENHKMALWEHDVYSKVLISDLSSRREKLREYIQKANNLIKDKEIYWNQYSINELKKHEWPIGIQSHEQALTRIDILKSVKESRFIPENNENAKHIVENMKKTEMEIEILKQSKINLDRDLQALRNQKNSELKFILSQVPEDIATELRSYFTHQNHGLKVAEENYNQRLAALVNAEATLNQKNSDYVVLLKSQGKLNDTYLSQHPAQNPHIDPMDKDLLVPLYNVIQIHELKMQEALDQFNNSRRQYRKALLVAMSLGEVFTQADPQGIRLKDSVIKLYGDTSFLKQDILATNSIEYQLQEIKYQRNQVYNRILKLQNQMDYLTEEYYRLMPSDHQHRKVYHFVWNDILNMPFSKFWSWLNDPALGTVRKEALMSMTRQWDDMWKDTVLQEKNYASSAWYTFKVEDGVIKIQYQ